jgi:hypothetical protein
MAPKSGKTEKAKPSEKPTKTSSKAVRKEKIKRKPEGDGQGPSKF